MQSLPIIPINGASADLEAQHFELTRELFELKALLRFPEQIPSGKLGHLRTHAKELEQQIELVELALGAVQTVGGSTATSSPRSKRFLEAFYAEACRQLPAQLRARLEQASANPRAIRLADNAKESSSS